MKFGKFLVLIALFFNLIGCGDIEKSVVYYPDYFSNLYTCPSLGFANSMFIRNDGTIKFAYPGGYQTFSYRRAEKNTYHVYNQSILFQKILVFENFYVIFDSDVENSVILQMTEEMFKNNTKNTCIKRNI